MKQYRSKELYGDFYENGTKPLVAVIGGSLAGLPTPINDRLLGYLKDNFNVLLLAYFGVGELPNTLEDVPIEYFINTITTVKNEIGLTNDQVIVIGISKGGEAALVLAERFPSAMTIACVADCYVFQGLPINEKSIKHPKSTWTFDGKELPYIKFYFDQEIMEAASNKNYSLCYEKSIEKNFNPDAIINIDNYNGKLLLLSAEHDNYWPSKKMSAKLLEDAKSKENITHITLDLKGHHFLDYDESVDVMIQYLAKNVC